MYDKDTDFVCRRHVSLRLWLCGRLEAKQCAPTWNKKTKEKLEEKRENKRRRTRNIQWPTSSNSSLKTVFSRRLFFCFVFSGVAFERAVATNRVAFSPKSRSHVHENAETTLGVISRVEKKKKTENVVCGMRAERGKEYLPRRAWTQLLI